jgi:hypothetical protein
VREYLEEWAWLVIATVALLVAFSPLVTGSSARPAVTAVTYATPTVPEATAAASEWRAAHRALSRPSEGDSLACLGPHDANTRSGFVRCVVLDADGDVELACRYRAGASAGQRVACEPVARVEGRPSWGVR